MGFNAGIALLGATALGLPILQGQGKSGGGHQNTQKRNHQDGLITSETEPPKGNAKNGSHQNGMLSLTKTESPKRSHQNGAIKIEHQITSNHIKPETSILTHQSPTPAIQLHNPATYGGTSLSPYCHSHSYSHSHSYPPLQPGASIFQLPPQKYQRNSTSHN